MILNEVHRGVRRNKKRKRIGRGIGSGQGKTAGRGHKGQGSRRGFSSKPTFQGGTMPLIRRVPKRGFNNRWGLRVAVVNIGQIEQAFSAGEEVSLEALAAKNLARGRFDELKILGQGQLKKKLKVSAHRFSKSAQEKIEKAGGQCIVLPGKTPVQERNSAADTAPQPKKTSPKK
jgi:large subunit ribosomal protein L15